MLVNDSSLLSTNSSKTIFLRIASTCLTDLWPGNISLISWSGGTGGGEREVQLTGDRGTWPVLEKRTQGFVLKECHDGYIGAKSL